MDVVDDAQPLFAGGAQSEVEEFGNVLQGRAGEDRRIVEAAVDLDVVRGGGHLQVVQGALAFGGDQLVGHDQAHAGAGLTVEGEVEGDIVDDVADAAAGDHHHRRVDQSGHAGVA